MGSFLADSAPFSYRRATQTEVFQYVGHSAGAWSRHWTVVDCKDRPFLFKKSEQVAKQAAEQLNFQAAMRIMADSKPQ